MHHMKISLINLLEQYENSILSLADYDEIWFFGDISTSFSQRASVIANKLDNFNGVVVTSISKEKRVRISNQIGGYGYWSFIDFDNLITRSKRKKVLLVDFNDMQSGSMFREYFRLNGVDVCDYLRCMNDLSVVHTYLPVNQERDYFINHLDDFLQLVNELPDQLSKDTVIARIKAFFTLDRRWLMGVSQGHRHFTRNKVSQNELIISDNETYIDVGAAHGDTVSKFFDVTRGLYKEIHAFEPDSVNYKGLSRLCEVIPNCNCYHAGLSDENGEMVFHETPENRFGSRFVTETSPQAEEVTKVKILRLDDVVDSATLIKIDVEGFEVNVLKGSKRIIEEYAPSMHIAGYHYPNDLISIIDAVKKIRNYKNIAIRHCDGTIYDTNILFSNHQNFV